ncbi:sugar phosphate isomerase/epimerase family protein [Paenibacillus harenae]|uniref:sugar phosphate isomerase/epimerase family protein n=1 Tax=Paenibacillus harenae TaxID=306543 RepID=UPI00041EF333|nr:sugar phosphate isomerase/epimerase family protein [Paenibacillus harenae]
MKYALCTISFRHQLISFSDLVRYALRHRFDGIELWGVHALNLYQYERESTREQLDKLQGGGLRVSMISDYFDISPEADFSNTLARCAQLIEAAGLFGVKRLRSFAGQRPSAELSDAERFQAVERLRQLCDLCQAGGIHLLLETHPNTLTDTVDATLALLAELDHRNARINLDFLHVWESGTDPIDGFERLKPWVDHFHLKNVTSARDLHVFHPHNVYSASGSRSGMVPLRAGALDYRAIIREIEPTGLYASLEWFGSKPLSVLQDELKWLRSSHREGSDPAFCKLLSSL